MWFCARCGEHNGEGTACCPNCGGARFPGREGPVCPSCGSEYRPGFKACADCGVPLVAPSCVPPSAAARLVKVWSSTKHTEAELLRVELRRAGIESVLENAGGADYAIGLGTALVPYVIAVAEPDAARAREILDAERAAPEAGPHPDRYIPPVAMIEFPCACGRTLEVPPDFDGLEMDCPFCGRPVRARKPS